jgi:hypothetical protein
MNNSQFRSFLSQTQSSKSPNGANSSTPTTRVPTLGSRARSSIPMTPRTVAGGGAHIDFRRQLSDLNEPPTKKFKSSGPKGVKLGKGYVDRAHALRTGAGAAEGDGGENSKEERLKNLEEMYKLQQIDEGMFDALRKELGVGGRVETSHLMKGLDWELLRRVKGGEDVLEAEGKEGEEQEGKGDMDVDVEDELDGVLSHEVQVKGKDEAMATATETQGEVEHPAAEVLSRDEILRRLKASRSAAAMPPPPPSAALNERFKKVGSDSKAEKKRFTEVVNGRRREVLLTTDKEGKSKRKVRWLDPPGTQIKTEEPVREVLGMEVPVEIAAKQKAALELQREEEEGDDDIFAGVGADYDPLAGIGSDEDDEEEDDDVAAKTQPAASEEPKEKPGKPRNYFGDTTDNEKDKSHPIANDPTILAALKRAAALRQAENANADKANAEEEEEDLDPERVLKRKAFLEKLKQQQAADARDLDMGFGESRFGDEEDEDGPLYDGSGDEKPKERRKRAPKKRKGDKDNVKDVLGVLEGRKGR